MRIALAEYRYTSSGNIFTMTRPGSDWILDPREGRSFQQVAISAELFTAEPLAAGDTTSDVLRFTMILSPWYGTWFAQHVDIVDHPHLGQPFRRL